MISLTVQPRLTTHAEYRGSRGIIKHKTAMESSKFNLRDAALSIQITVASVRTSIIVRGIYKIPNSNDVIATPIYRTRAD